MLVARMPTEVILARAQQGDPQALDELLFAEREFLALQVRRQLDASLRSRVEDDDVLQEVRIRVVRSIASAELATLTALRGWLATIVRNAIIDLRRRHFQTKKRCNAQISIDQGSLTSGSGVTTTLRDRLSADQPGPSSVVRRKEDLVLLDVALQRLKPHHREILRQVHYERLRLQDIAVRTGRKPATVRKEFARALLACRKVLDALHGGSAPRRPRTGRRDGETGAEA
jgi:RNA polymerase sigma-70 factor (subfamily 1)